MRRPHALIATTLAALALAGCGSTGSTTAAAPPGTTAPAAPAATPSSSPSPQCSTYACVAKVMQRDAVGIVAANESVVTGARCRTATVKRNPGDTWTAHCTVKYSDGSTATGFITLLPDQGKIAFQPDGT